MKRADKIVSTQSKNPSNQSEDLQSFLKEMLEELSRKYNASGDVGRGFTVERRHLDSQFLAQEKSTRLSAMGFSVSPLGL